MRSISAQRGSELLGAAAALRERERLDRIVPAGLERAVRVALAQIGLERGRALGGACRAARDRGGRLGDPRPCPRAAPGTAGCGRRSTLPVGRDWTYCTVDTTE